MSEEVNSSPSHRQMIKFYTTRKEELVHELAIIDETIRRLTAYSIEWSLGKKVVYFLKNNKRVMTLTQLVEIIMTNDSNKGFIHIRRELAVNLSATLGVYCKKDVSVGRIKFEVGGKWFYGLKQWFEENGDLSEEYIP